MGNSSNKGAIGANKQAVSAATEAVAQQRAKKGAASAKTAADAASGDDSPDDYDDEKDSEDSDDARASPGGRRTDPTRAKKTGAPNRGKDPKADDEVEDAYDVNDFSKAMTD